MAGRHLPAVSLLGLAGAPLNKGHPLQQRPQDREGWGILGHLQAVTEQFTDEEIEEQRACLDLTLEAADRGGGAEGQASLQPGTMVFVTSSTCCGP